MIVKINEHSIRCLVFSFMLIKQAMCFNELSAETLHKDFLESFVALQVHQSAFSDDMLESITTKFESANPGGVVGAYVPRVKEDLHQLIISNSWVCAGMERSPPAFKHTWACDMVIMIKKYAIAEGLSVWPFPGGAGLFTADGPTIAFLWDMRVLCQRGVQIRDQWKYLMHNMSFQQALQIIQVIRMRPKQYVCIPPTHCISLVVDGSLAWNRVLVSPIMVEAFYEKTNLEFYELCHKYMDDSIAKMGVKKTMQNNQVEFSKWLGTIVNVLRANNKKATATGAQERAPTRAIADGVDNSAPPPQKRRKSNEGVAAAGSGDAAAAVDVVAVADDIADAETDDEAREFAR